jgi:hypothetical protein
MAFNATYHLNTKRLHQYIINFIQPVKSKKITSYLYHATTNTINIKKFYKAEIDLSDFNDSQIFISKLYLENCLHGLLGDQKNKQDHYNLLKLLNSFNLHIDTNLIEKKDKILIKLCIHDVKLFKKIDISIPYYISTNTLEMDILFQSAKNTYDYDITKELNNITTNNFDLDLFIFKQQIIYPIIQNKFIELNSDKFMKYMKITLYDKQFDIHIDKIYDNKEKLQLLNNQYWNIT